MIWVFAHRNCPDGLGAAYAAWTVLRDTAQYKWVAHEDDFAAALAPVQPGDEVYVADFCFPYDTLTKLSACRRVTILDHHVTAEPIIAQARERLGMDAHYDVTRSGAMMAWEHFHPDQPAPMIIRHVQDKDLWQFKLDKTREVLEALSAHGDSFEVWDRFATSEADYQSLVAEGTLLLRAKRAIIDRLLENVRFVTIAGERVPAVNTPIYASEVANLLLERFPDAPFAATYSDANGLRRWSLRSGPSRARVSEVAQLFGGGGHDAAAGFSQPLGDTVASPPEPDTTV